MMNKQFLISLWGNKFYLSCEKDAIALIGNAADSKTFIPFDLILAVAIQKLLHLQRHHSHGESFEDPRNQNRF